MYCISIIVLLFYLGFTGPTKLSNGDTYEVGEGEGEGCECKWGAQGRVLCVCVHLCVYDLLG